MRLTFRPFTVKKRVPLTISRGTHSQSTNFWVQIEQDGLEGWGEATPFSIGSLSFMTDAIAAELTNLSPELTPYHPLDRQAIHRHLDQLRTSSPVRAAIDVALHDWLGKQTAMPLWQIWGLACQPAAPISVTIGISSPTAAQQRLQDWLQQGPFQAVKVKLGSPEGIDADQAMIIAILEKLPAHTQLSVDANGGWSLSDALTMSTWLAHKGVTYLEQPLPVDRAAELAILYEKSSLPIFVDESCFTSRDIPPLADRVHGINIKLMKSGGLSEAYRMIHTAHACGLQVMFGCYSDSSLSNTALAHLSSLATHLDLDSHLNLVNDPFSGASFQDGHLLPNRAPGLGLSYHAKH
ncbi:dipeptide epimerase [Pseudanabaena sp. FACHB-2040]|uniref:dipeptide epimerase n=1 Tax=Pseudanabaena sp. FACHB-2040 TaxID=2692859 RepID=UPI001685AA3A|nr:dipeptide epimerase [Pseudanabaena sp. FACHB-2040]MBD2258122.1 dipeptide epimerase [Pseudanabaena sp. FACHB-2040]